MLIKTKKIITLSFVYFIFSFFLKSNNMEKIIIKSSAFKNKETIPTKYTCDGQNISPELSWKNIPNNTKSLVIIYEDPDAVHGTWTHWILFNISPTITHLSENVSDNELIQNNINTGLNDFKNTNYGGPCPPSKIHRYIFKIFALDIKINLNSGATKKQIESAMKNHILSQGKLTGKYSRKK